MIPKLKELTRNWEIFWCFKWTQLRVWGKTFHHTPCHLKLNNAGIFPPLFKGVVARLFAPQCQARLCFLCVDFRGAVQTQSRHCQKMNTEWARFINQKLNTAARNAGWVQALFGTIWLKSASPQVWCPAAAVRAGTDTTHVPWQALPVSKGRGSSWICISSSSKKGEKPPQLQAMVVCECLNSSGLSCVC